MNWFRNSSFFSIIVVLSFIVVAWYLGAVYLNSPVLIDKYERHNVEWDFSKLVDDSWSMDRPIMHAPHQFIFDIEKSILKHKIRKILIVCQIILIFLLILTMYMN